tara:strand:+ start:1241 stop:1387 length:147 start_codon:yes stop_codon:yes gene_type:complete
MTKRKFKDVEEEFLKSLLPKRLLNAVEMQKAKERIWKRIQNTTSDSES